MEETSKKLNVTYVMYVLYYDNELYSNYNII